MRGAVAVRLSMLVGALLTATCLGAEPNREPKATGIGKIAEPIEAVVEKKYFEMFGDPWTLQAIPIIFPSPESGFNLGVRASMQNIRRQDPHKLEIEAQALGSDRGRYKHFLRVDVPHAFSDRIRFTARAAYDRDISLPYYGVSNDPPVNRRTLRVDDPLYANKRAVPSIHFDLFAYLSRQVRLGPILGLRWAKISYEPGSLLDLEKPSGIAGGKTHYAGFGIIWDTLDWEPYPSRGMYHELYVYAHGPFSSSDYEFERYTYTFRSYLRLHRRLVFAHRTVAEVLNGDAPFYELGALGGSNSSIAFGSDRFFRGYAANLFIDRYRLASSFELRWDPLFYSTSGEDFTLGFVPFFDVGRVWHSAKELQMGGLHGSMGMGVRILWNQRIVIRGDYALTRDGGAVYVNINNAF